MKNTKAPKACERCRRQKLKCDAQRPCTLCLRSGVQCVVVDRDVWRTHDPQNSLNKVRQSDGEIDSPRSSKRRRVSPSGQESDRTPTKPSALHANIATPQASSSSIQASDRTSISISPGEAFQNSSSAVTFVQEAFGSHGVNTTAETVSSLNGVGAKLWARKSRSTAAEKLAKLLPQLEPASILVETYFDRVHWFTLIFHQRNFRERFEALYHGLKHHSKSSSADLGFLGLLLAVFAVSLNHAGDRRTRALISYGMDPGRWKDEILTALKTSLLDIVALGSLEAVQTCILLGSYHLYQGEPELAWPLCGCGLRIAQALNLHRRMNTTSEASEHIDSIRRRCWWAVYEIETFCSMLYGFPLSISDPDCDVALLDAHDRFSTAVNGKLPGEITLLSYKCAMSELSLIIRGALTDLYGAGRVSIDKQAPSLKSTSGLQNLTKKVTNLDSKLQQWYDSLPIELRVHGIGTSGNLAPLLEPYESTSAQDKAFERHLFQIQAITLQFAFQNARILIHRPLLSYNKVPQSDQAGHNAAHPDNPVRTSINTCREAGLELSNLIAAPLFKEASNTYAAAFICVHLLTAGITLCIMSSFESLSKESHECKMGVRKIMEAQTLLVSKSIVAEQGLEVLKNLVTLMSKKELDKMLDFEISTDLGARDQQVQAHPGVAGESAMLLQNPTLNQSSTLLTRLSIPDESGAMAPYENANDDTFGLREGPWMAQALMDLGLVINETSGISVERQGESDQAHEGPVNDFFVGQDQSWLWGTREYI